MAKKQTKADLILSEARERAQNAKKKVQELEADLYAAQASFNAHYEALAHLEKALAPRTRKKTAPAAASAPAQKDLPTEPAAKEPLCGACGNVEDYADHFKPSPNYHPFDRPASSVTRRSSRKGAVTNSTVNSETLPAVVGDAAPDVINSFSAGD